MSARVAGKVALITGGASGVGRATALLLAREGARVVISDINVADGLALAEEIGSQALFVEHDAGSETDWARVIETVRKHHARLDILFNNAGILLKGDIENTTYSEWQRVQRINADSVFLGCRAAISLMNEGEGGSIINMSSIAAVAGRDDYVAYSASKGSVAALSRTVAVLCRRRKYRIRCNSLHPDGILTPMTTASLPAGLDPWSLTIDADPMGRMCLPEDVAASVLFLASDESRAISGIELRIDSGQFVMSI